MPTAASKGKGPLCYEANAHVPLIIEHPDGKAGGTTSALTSHLDLLPTLFGLTALPETSRPTTLRALPGHDFSAKRDETPLDGNPACQ